MIHEHQSILTILGSKQCHRNPKEVHKKLQLSGGNRIENGSAQSLSEFDGFLPSPGHQPPAPNGGEGCIDRAQDEVDACVRVIGNYVRANVETAANFFRDMLPTVVLMGAGMKSTRDCGRVPRRLSAVLRELVRSTR